MARIFLSHSSVDNAQAVGLRDWLATEGWDDVFLDLDPNRGITAGERWERALNEAALRCEAVLFLVSHAWLSSDWCRKELTLAQKLDKRLFGVLIESFEPAELPAELSGTWQVVDLVSGRDHRLFRVTLPRTHDECHVTFSQEGLKRLRAGLVKAGLDPRFFEWPPETDPDRSPYRGLRPLEADDAGIFFGRDAPIFEALDQLRGLREDSLPRFLVILGASGAGKSSFLRAGLFARMKRYDRDFLPLPIVRPERAAISGDNGLLRALEVARTDARINLPRSKIRAAIDGGAQTLRPVLRAFVEAATPETGDADSPAKPPALVISIDQGEELFRAEGHDQSQQLLNLLRELLDEDDPALIVVIAIRSDSYAQLQEAKALEEVRKVPFDLGPMPQGSYAEVIKGPATRLEETTRRLKVDDGLVSVLLRDIEVGGAKDALPLLSFTMERLYLENGGTGRLTVTDYRNLGGIAGSIEEAVEQALTADTDPPVPIDRAARLALLRHGMIPWLADIDPDTGAPRRRVARRSEIPADSRALLRNLVEQRLLTTDIDKQTGERTIEPAHEALLRQWSLLEGWLTEDTELLAVLEGVKRASRDWAKENKSTAWLTHAADRLAAAEDLRHRPDLAANLDETNHEYLAVCRTSENERLAAEKRQREAELEAARALAAAETQAREEAQAHAVVLRKRSRVLRAVLAATAVVAVIALIGGITAVISFAQASTARNEAQGRFREATGLRLVAEAQGVLAGARPGGDARAFDELLASRSLTPTPDDGALFSAVVKRVTTRTIIATLARNLGVAFSPDGHRLASASANHTILLWDGDTGQPIGNPLAGHTEEVNGVAFSPDGHRLASAGDDNTIRVWDGDTGRPIDAPLTGHTNSVFGVAFSPDGHRLASGSADHTVRLWDADTGQPIGTPLTGHTNAVRGVAFSPDGHRLASASDDATVRLWDADTGQPIGAPLTGHTNSVHGVAFSPDGHRVASASDDATVRLWDADTGQPIGAPLTGHHNSVLGVAFSPDGHRLASGSGDATVRVWDADTGQPIGQPLTGHTNSVFGVAFSPDGRRLASASADATVRVWNVAATDQPLTGHTADVYGVAFSPDGHRLASTSADKTIRLWDADTGQPIGAPLTGHTDKVNSVAFSPDGHRLASASKDHTIRLWDADTGRPIGAPLTGHTDWVYSVAFSPDGHRLASASLDGTVRLWDADTGQPIGKPLTGHTGQVYGVAFSPDGHRLASAGADETVRVWNADTGQPIGKPLTASNRVISVAFSPDGHRLASGSSDDTIRLWNADTGQPIGDALTGHTATVASVAFSPDGHRLASASYDMTVRVWDAGTGRPIGDPLLGHKGAVSSVAFSPDGTRIVSGSDDHTLRLWPAVASPTDLCNKLTANMSHQQWRDWVSPHIHYIQVCPSLPVRADNPS